MGLRNGSSLGIRKKHIRIGNKFDCVEGVTNWHFVPDQQKGWKNDLNVSHEILFQGVQVYPRYAKTHKSEKSWI